MQKIIKPVLIVIAGPNGSGKTQLTKVLREKYPRWIKNLVEVNPDLIAQEEFGNWNDPIAIQSAANPLCRSQKDKNNTEVFPLYNYL